MSGLQDITYLNAHNHRATVTELFHRGAANTHQILLKWALLTWQTLASQIAKKIPSPADRPMRVKPRRQWCCPGISRNLIWKWRYHVPSSNGKPQGPRAVVRATQPTCTSAISIYILETRTENPYGTQTQALSTSPNIFLLLPLQDLLRNRRNYREIFNTLLGPMTKRPHCTSGDLTVSQ